MSRFEFATVTRIVILGSLALGMLGVAGVSEADAQRGRWLRTPDSGIATDLDSEGRKSESSARSNDPERGEADAERTASTPNESRRSPAERLREARSARDRSTMRSTDAGHDRRRLPVPDGDNAISRGRYAVLVDLDENRLYFMEGEVVLWDAPVGTGTGMRVITHDDNWEFTTPTGEFEVQYKELDPVWIAPDWYFVENNLPVPAPNHRSRYMKGTLGVAAIYISPNLAIHGTNRPELIGQRVSHGCIRLENRFALRLYHNVQVGTEVIIVGGDEVRRNARTVDLRDGYDPSLASTGSSRSLPRDRLMESWKRMDTAELLESLDAELELPSSESRWDEITVLLVDRAVEGDAKAMLGVLTRTESLPSARIESEWATFLGDLYRRSTLGTLEGLAALTGRDREEVAKRIVMAMITLYRGEYDSPAVPWPSARIPSDRLTWRAQRGRDAILSVEAEIRSSFTEPDEPDRELLGQEIQALR